MSSSAHNIVIVLGCKHGGLATIRALGRCGISVIALTDDPQDFGLASKYISESAICPHPSDDKAFVDFMLNHADRWRGALILETNDYYAVTIAQNREVLAEYYLIITPNNETTKLFIEKDKTYALAKEIGIPHPRLIQSGRLTDIEIQIEEMTFPIMIKPVKSHEFVEIFGEKLFVVNDTSQLRDLFVQIQDAQLEVMIQEIIPGTDYGTLESVEIYIDSQGDIRAELFNVKLRQTPPMWGVMRVGKSVPPIADIRDYAHKLLQAIGYRGFASLEFKRDPRDGIPKLIEVNIRQPRNNQLIIASGVNIPWLIYQDKILNIRESVENYTPTYYIDLMPDIANSIVREPSIILNIPRFLKPYFARYKTFAVFDFDDFQPFCVQLKNKMSKLNRLIKR